MGGPDKAPNDIMAGLYPAAAEIGQDILGGGDGIPEDVLMSGAGAPAGLDILSGGGEPAEFVQDIMAGG
ncbi:MAG: hypothetical protein M0Z41_01165 [Peptococcaceae bacterium]|jgi:hypothetical protein|nr:hypothetical protein [Peptococcaceae bacterium]